MNEIMKGIVAQLGAAAPRLLTNLKRDRDWLWLEGNDQKTPKVREVLKELGFHYSRRGHAFDDESTAHWYHPCGGRTGGFRRRAKAQPVVTTDEAEPAEHRATARRDDLEVRDPVAEFQALFA